MKKITFLFALLLSGFVFGQCDPITSFPYAHGFETLDCWTNSSTSTPWALDDGSDFGPGSVTEGAQAVFFNDYDFSSGSTSDLMSPYLDTSSLSLPRLTFDYYDGGGSDTVEVLVFDGTDTVVVYETAGTVNTWTEIVIDLPQYAGQTIKIGFRGTSVYGTSNPHIDNLVVAEGPTCLAPTGITVSGLSTVGATLSWTAGNTETDYEYVVQAAGTGEPTASGTAVTGATTVDISSLDPQTDYEVYVRSACDAGEFSTWTGPETFFTGYCVPSSTSSSTYVDSFVTEGGTTNINSTSSGYATDGYSDQFSGTESVSSFAEGSFTFTSTIVGGTAGFALWVDWNNDLTFDTATETIFNTTSYGSGPFSGSVSVPAGTANGDYRMRIMTDYSDSNPDDNACAFNATRGEVEDYKITVIDPPSCLDPVDFVVSDITSVGATIAWSGATAQTGNVVEFDTSYTWLGYMNWFELAENGGGFVSGGGWGVSDLKSVADTSANTLTLQPNFNTYGDNPTDGYWVNQDTGAGNKNMQASTYVEDLTLNGADLTFHGSVASYTLDPAYTAKFFIKALDPANNYADAFGGSKTFDLPESGNFTVSASAAELATGLIVQYGFEVFGANANPANETALGSVVVTTTEVATWEYELVLEGETPTGTGTITTDNPLTILGCYANTGYDLYVRRVCDSGNSNWTMTSFTTECETVSTFPYAHGFETLDCWTNSSTSTPWALDDGSDFGPGSVTEGAQAVFFNDYDFSSGSTSDLMSPYLDTSSLSLPRLTFDYYDGGGSDTVEVLVFDGTDTVVVYETAGTVNTWTEIVIDLPQYAGQTIKIGFRGTSVYGTSNPHIDNLVVAEGPTCLAPTGITVSAISANGATLSWTAGNTETDYEYVVQAAGTGEPTASGTAVTGATTVDISSLDPQTDYEVYVRSDCGAGDFSSWTGPVVFTTLCATVTTYPDVTTFDNNPPTDCWNEADSGEIIDGPSDLGSGSWRSGTTYNDGTSSVPSNAINLYSNNKRDWLISPIYDVSVGDLSLIVHVAVTNWNTEAADNMGSDDEVSLLMTADYGTTWTVLEAWNASNQPATNGTEFVYDLSGMTGEIQFAFLGSDGTTDDSQDYDFHVGYMELTSALSVQNIELTNALRSYPNPVIHSLTIQSQDNIQDVTVFNMLGQRVARLAPNANHVQVDMSTLKTGVYFAKVTTAKGTETLRILKQ